MIYRRPPRRAHLLEPVLWGVVAVVAVFVLIPALAELADARNKELEAAEMRDQATQAMRLEHDRLNRLLNDPAEDQKLAERYRLGVRSEEGSNSYAPHSEENP